MERLGSGPCSSAPDHSVPRLSPRRTRQLAPRIPRVETRWRNAAAAGEQCLGSKDHKERPKVKNTRRYRKRWSCTE
ncbi:hypothetical protein AALO_G00084740 [Alosa alosa]|uniref:Uncharacterized protein n=1 Tax=Alosa alosa TaxID=278164 RepID=A0AAV6H1W9_9TELE|nr:hypothetical protein AALO_G00084740 [Alosa alosa]